MAATFDHMNGAVGSLLFLWSRVNNLTKPPSKLTPFADKQSAWLAAESRKPRKQRRTVKQLH